MNISDLGQASRTPSRAEQNSSTNLGKEDFLKLLTVQLQYQDPLNPLENTEFIAQMAQFSSLEQLQNMNQAMDRSMESESILHNSMRNNLATSLIGKSVEIPTGEIAFSGDGESTLAYRLDAGAIKASVQITDARSNLVKEFEVEPSQRYGSITWDGKSAAGSEVPPGAYRISVLAEGPGGTPISGEALKSVKVQAIRNLAGEATIWAGNREISLAELSGVLSGE
tara:strand:+ start:26 stop:700 length:675 start_codon:yes stop_codon:yes gene_type:complete